ncbi:lysozyme [Burkholderia cepacia]|uniref:lysozyme n=1 Tax=Burkholderia cepacia TaxID=292 RepID=UPI00398EAFC2
MGLSDLLRAIFSLFGSAPAAAPTSAAASQSAPSVPVSPPSGTKITDGVPQIVPVEPSATPVPAGAPVVSVSVAPVVKPEVTIRQPDSSVSSISSAGDGWLPLARPLSQHFESCYLTAYPDPASPLGKALQARGLWFKVLAGAPIPNDPGLRALSGAPWTCGWGSTGPDVREGTRWTQEMADLRHDENLRAAAALVDQAVRVPLSAQQKAAMTSIVNNVGTGRARRADDSGRDGIIVLASGQPSTLLRHLNVGDFAGAADQFLVWNKAGGIVEPGLMRRRAAERDLFLTGKWSAA